MNDRPDTVELRLEVWAVAMDGTSRLLVQGGGGVTGERAVDLAMVPRDAVAAGEILSFVWTGAGIDGSDIHAPLPWKAYDLRPAGIEAAVEQIGEAWQITLTARALAPFVAIEADVAGRFSDNAVTLLPCLPVTIRFVPQAPGERPVFTIRDLQSATYGPPREGA